MEGHENKKQDETLAKKFDSYCRNVLIYAGYNLARDATKVLLREEPGGIDLRSGESGSPVAEQEDGFIVCEGDISISVDSEELLNALRGVSKSGREILLLNVVFEVPLAEIAKKLGLSYGSVKAIKSQTLKKLKKKVKHRREKR